MNKKIGGAILAIALILFSVITISEQPTEDIVERVTLLETKLNNLAESYFKSNVYFETQDRKIIETIPRYQEPVYKEFLEIHDSIPLAVLVDSTPGSQVRTPCEFGQQGEPYCILEKFGTCKIVNLSTGKKLYDWCGLNMNQRAFKVMIVKTKTLEN